MTARTIEEKETTALKPFVLPEMGGTGSLELLWSRNSVFSTPVNGLDISMVMVPDYPESTGGADTHDSTST